MNELSTLVDEWTRGTIPGGFALRSGYYAGRPPSQGDINTKVLEGLYNGIKKEAGNEAAINFVRFVNRLDDMAASSFVVAFEQFWAQDCKVTEIEQRVEDRTRIDAYGDAAMSQGLAVIAEALGRKRKTPEEYQELSNSVKAEFVLRHQDQIPVGERRKMKSTIYGS